ncbi:protein Son isoform X2 [Tenebrio molitor]|uniref:protein Son isoform X2 n=1 Tax=Tenebrio molitor TaxID=7067 RepID=UPI0036246E82
MPSEEQKPVVDAPVKSSMEILSELFNSFDAEPPLIIKKEKSDSPGKKPKKSKKKHKHKDKKHKKKEKKKKREHSPSSDKTEIDLAEILIKQEKESSEQKIRIEGTDLSFNIKKEKESKCEKKNEVKGKMTSNGKNLEDGEVQSENSSDERKHKKRKHKSDHDKGKKRKKEEESGENLQLKIDDLRNKIKGGHTSRSKDRRSRSREKRSKSREDDFYRKREKSREHRSREREKYKDVDHKNKRNGRGNSFYKEDDFWGKDRHRSRHDRERDRRHRDRSSSRDSSHIDKKKLLEIARKNAIQMMKSGSLPGALTLGPQAQEKVIAAIKAGGKTIEELTDFCKTLSKKEELGELSSNTEGNGSDSDTDKPFHHPFQIKDRPTSITMNIKNSVPLPIKSTQERTSELRLQFPVSSGQLHRKTENEWVPVSPKKSQEPVPVPKPVEAPAVKEVKENATPAAVVPGPQVFPQAATDLSAVDIGSIVSQRLTAIRKLQENPNDVQALTQMYKSNKEMQSWAQSKQQPGQFTGTTGAQVLSHAELSAGYQAWAKKASVRLLNQGSSCGNWLSTNKRGPVDLGDSGLGGHGNAPVAKDGVEAGGRSGQREDRRSGAAPVGG